jgi:uncharacterized RDD family membrane protein YckC
MENSYPTFKYKTNFRKRILATLLDYGLFYLLFYVYLLFVGETGSDGMQRVSGLIALPIPIVWFIYFVVIESLGGATLGHQGFGLKVVTLERRDDIGIEHAFKRHILDPLDIFFYGIPASIAIKFTDKHQRLGDLLAKTIVIDTSDPEQFDPIVIED